MPKIVHTREEKLKLLYLSLCNIQGYGAISECVTNKQYAEAKKTAKVFDPVDYMPIEQQTICLEDVVMNHLITTGSIPFHDQYEDELIVRTLDEILSALDELPYDNAKNFIEECDDAIDADAVLQLAALGEIIYG